MNNTETKYKNPTWVEKNLGISKSRQARLRCDGKLSYHKFNSFVYYDINVLEQMIEDGKVC